MAQFEAGFSSLGALQVALALPPNHEVLTRAPIAEDLRVLDHAARDAEVRDMAHGKQAVERLWDACQIPDYRKIAPAAHAELVTTLFGFLMREGKIPDAWFATQVDQADRIDGDIDTLSGRIAQIRTWTFVANRLDWLKDPSIGRKPRARSKINYLTRCMNVSRSVSLTVGPVY